MICCLYTSGTSQRTKKAGSEPEDLKEDTLDILVDGKTLREIVPMMPLAFQFNRNLKKEDWKDMDQVLQLHKLLKDLFQWSMENKRFLEERETRIREDQATIQAIEEQLNQTEPTLIPSGSQGVDQPKSPVASHHSVTSKSVAKSHHSPQFQVVFRRRQGYKCKNRTSFSQRQRESDPIIQKMLEFVKEVQKS
ncbi:hypothetical protein O181_024040 [Austropuccinia psidii MF-1]|uniref:Uncharacterized protein n=1 Tax=Austropuccinia psidii MF-1 TaxID=1389203 RepID=A0A9Q3CJS4_9BASI|nr:hypothetical protein [Austropuccinia psidii MF-1]